MRDLYKPVSKHYDRLSSVYSLGEISKCRNAFIAEICDAIRSAESKAVKVCVVGAGHGVEAIAMAEIGAMVTVVDCSQSMLEVFREKLNRASGASSVSDEVIARVNVIHDDVRNVNESFDWVVANFFLNVFSESEMLEMLDRLIQLVDRQDSGGKLIIGDFFESRGGNRFGNRVVRFLQRLNWYVALFLFRVFVKNARHPIYDYSEHLSDRGWKAEKMKKFGLLGVSFYAASLYSKSASTD